MGAGGGEVGLGGVFACKNISLFPSRGFSLSKKKKK